MIKVLVCERCNKIFPFPEDLDTRPAFPEGYRMFLNVYIADYGMLAVALVNHYKKTGHWVYYKDYLVKKP